MPGLSDENGMADAVLDTPSAASTEAAWKEVALLVLNATAQYAVHCGDAEVSSFRKLVRESAEQLQQPGSLSQVFIAAGVLSQAIAHYSTQTQRQVDALLSDLSSMLQAFLAHLEKPHGDPESRAMVAQLRATLEGAIGAGKLADAREEAAAALSQLSEQADQKRRQTLELTGKLQDRVTILEQSLPAAARPAPPEGAGLVLNACTGLPMRTEAEAAMRRASGLWRAPRLCRRLLPAPHGADQRPLR